MTPSNDNGAGDLVSPAAKAAEHLEVATRCLQEAGAHPDAARGLLRAAARHAELAAGELTMARLQPGALGTVQGRTP